MVIPFNQQPLFILRLDLINVAYGFLDGIQHSAWCLLVELNLRMAYCYTGILLLPVRRTLS